jgi:hypothetical protein
MKTAYEIKPAEGKLGILIPGMGAVATTVMAGVYAVREELNQLTRTDLLKVEKNGRSVFYGANTEHALFPELRSMVQKVMGIDRVIDGIVNRLGKLEQAYLIDDYAEGKDTGIIDLILVGDVNAYHLNDLCRKTERYMNRKIRTVVISRDERLAFFPRLESRPHLLIWAAGNGNQAPAGMAPGLSEPE